MKTVQVYDFLGVAALDHGHVSKAVWCFEQALELEGRRPDTTEHRWRMSMFLNDLGAALEGQARGREAMKAYRQAIKNQQVALAREQGEPKYRYFLDLHFRNLGRLERTIGSPTEAAILALERQKLWPDDPDHLFEIACELAQCLAADREKSMGNSERSLERSRYADSAITSLKRALALGLSNPNRVVNDPNLGPLRSLVDLGGLLLPKTPASDSSGKETR